MTTQLKDRNWGYKRWNPYVVNTFAHSSTHLHAISPHPEIQQNSALHQRWTDFPSDRWGDYNLLNPSSPNLNGVQMFNLQGCHTGGNISNNHAINVKSIASEMSLNKGARCSIGYTEYTYGYVSGEHDLATLWFDIIFFDAIKPVSRSNMRETCQYAEARYLARLQAIGEYHKNTGEPGNLDWGWDRWTVTNPMRGAFDY